jgi:hypothetical protein
MKKVILALFAIMLTSVAFSQVEGFSAVFERISLIESKEKVWKSASNFKFESNGEIYVLAYEPCDYVVFDDIYQDLKKGAVADKDLYLFRKDTTSAIGWVKATGLIRHDYFHWTKVPYSNSTADSLRAINQRNRNYKDDPSSYGSVKIDSNGVVTIELKTIAWKKDEQSPLRVYDDLILTPNGDKTYSFILKRIPTEVARKRIPTVIIK